MAFAGMLEREVADEIRDRKELQPDGARRQRVFCIAGTLRVAAEVKACVDGIDVGDPLAARQVPRKGKTWQQR